MADFDPRLLFPGSDPLLLPSQRQQVFEWIAGTFDPARFDLRDEGAQDYRGAVATVSMRDRPYWFSFHHHTGGGWSADFAPGVDTRTAETRIDSWDGVIGPAFQIWLNTLDRELSASDPWTEIERELQLAAGVTQGESNESFTPEEQQVVSGRVQEIRAYVEGQGLTPDALAEINAHLSNIEESASRVGRKDWKLIVIGSFTSMMTGAVVPPEVIRASLGILLRGLEHLFGLPGPPPELLA